MACLMTTARRLRFEPDLTSKESTETRDLVLVRSLVMDLQKMSWSLDFSDNHFTNPGRV